MAHDVCVRYSVNDKVVADAIVARLEADSIRCSVAPAPCRAGILVFSHNANASRQIKREVERADDKGVYTIPFRIDDIEPTKSLEYPISTAQWMDAFSLPLEPRMDFLPEAVADGNRA